MVSGINERIKKYDELAANALISSYFILLLIIIISFTDLIKIFFRSEPSPACKLKVAYIFFTAKNIFPEKNRHVYFKFIVMPIEI